MHILLARTNLQIERRPVNLCTELKSCPGGLSDDHPDRTVLLRAFRIAVVTSRMTADCTRSSSRCIRSIPVSPTGGRLTRLAARRSDTSMSPTFRGGGGTWKSFPVLRLSGDRPSSCEMAPRVASFGSWRSLSQWERVFWLEWMASAN